MMGDGAISLLALFVSALACLDRGSAPDFVHASDWQLWAQAEVQALPSDFMMGNYFCSTHPDSPFAKQRIVALQTADGRKTMNGNELKIFQGDQVQEHQLKDSEVPAALEQHFGIPQPEA